MTNLTLPIDAAPAQQFVERQLAAEKLMRQIAETRASIDWSKVLDDNRVESREDLYERA